MTGVREQIKELNSKIVDDFYGNENTPARSITDLATSYGRSPAMINKLLRTDKLKNGQRIRYGNPRDPRPAGEKKPISLLHTYIGLCVSRYMSDHELGLTAFGMLSGLNMSRVQVGEVVAGSRDLTLTDVQKLSEVLGIPYDRLAVLPKDFVIRPQVTYDPTTKAA